MKIAYLFFNGQLRGSKKFYSNLIGKQRRGYLTVPMVEQILPINKFNTKRKYMGDLDSIKDEVKRFLC